MPQRGISGRMINTMRVTPRDDAGWRLCPRKLDRQPSLFACALLAVRETSAAPRARGNKKSAVSRMLARAWSDCAFSSQLSSSFTGSSRRCSLLYEPDHYTLFVSVYFLADFVNIFSTLYLALHCIGILCWDEIPTVWHHDTYIRCSFAMNIKRISPIIGYYV
jgi:hypothetical protein